MQIGSRIRSFRDAQRHKTPSVLDGVLRSALVTGLPACHGRRFLPSCLLQAPRLASPILGPLIRRTLLPWPVLLWAGRNPIQQPVHHWHLYYCNRSAVLAGPVFSDLPQSSTWLVSIPVDRSAKSSEIHSSKGIFLILLFARLSKIDPLQSVNANRDVGLTLALGTVMSAAPGDAYASDQGLAGVAGLAGALVDKMFPLEKAARTLCIDVVRDG